MTSAPSPDDRGPLRIASARGRWTLLATVLGSSVVMLGSTVTNVALPHIGADFDAGLGVLQWTANAYMLTLAALILLGGSLGDRFGRRRVFVVGIVWFAVASLLCGVAPDSTTLITARALQGVGGALITPGSLAIIEASFHPDDRPRTIGLWSGFGGIGAAVGICGRLAGGRPRLALALPARRCAGAPVPARRAASRPGVRGHAPRKDSPVVAGRRGRP